MRWIVKYKLIMVIIVIVLVIGGGIFELIYLDKCYTGFVERLDEIMAQEPYDIESVYDTRDWLDKKHKGMEYFVPHFELNELSISYAELVGAIEKEDYDSASAILHRLRQHAIRQGDIFKFRIQNIV